MKKYNLLFFICLFSSTLTGQISKSDRGQTALTQLSPDTASKYIDSLNVLSEKYIFLNTDSSLQYAQKALFSARKFDLTQAQSKAFYLLGGNYWIMGNYPNALELELQSLKLSEKINDGQGIADTYRALASIYRDNGDFTNSIYYAKKCAITTEKRHLIDIYTVIGSIFEKFNQLDSAVVYLNLANRKDIAENGKSHYGYISLIFGNVSYKKRDFPSAIHFYLCAIDLFKSQQVHKDLIEGYNGIAKVYRTIGKTDSSIAYLRNSLLLANQSPFLLGMLDASTMLHNIYKSRSELDSTVKYLELSLSLKDTLYDQQKVRAFQALVFNEKLREQELETFKAKAREEHLQNVQIASIAAFIPLFFLVAFLLSRKKIKKSIIEFLVLVWLLLVFEFISLLIHSHLENWTHHTPVLMLLAMVAIAAVLVPSHHRLLEFLKNLLAKPNNTQVGRLHTEEIEKET